MVPGKLPARVEPARTWLTATRLPTARQARPVPRPHLLSYHFACLELGEHRGKQLDLYGSQCGSKETRAVAKARLAAKTKHRLQLARDERQLACMLRS